MDRGVENVVGIRAIFSMYRAKIRARRSHLAEGQPQTVRSEKRSSQELDPGSHPPERPRRQTRLSKIPPPSGRPSSSPGHWSVELQYPSFERNDGKRGSATVQPWPQNAGPKARPPPRSEYPDKKNDWPLSSVWGKLPGPSLRFAPEFQKAWLYSWPKPPSNAAPIDNAKGWPWTNEKKDKTKQKIRQNRPSINRPEIGNIEKPKVADGTAHKAERHPVPGSGFCCPCSVAYALR